ncbi:hypothetical protein GCM10028806_07190 [Spirosoma terrae]
MKHTARKQLASSFATFIGFAVKMDEIRRSVPVTDWDEPVSELDESKLLRLPGECPKTAVNEKD